MKTQVIDLRKNKNKAGLMEEVYYYILNRIDCEGYDMPNNMQSIKDIYTMETKTPFNSHVLQWGIEGFSFWLGGLPSCINLPYFYEEINEVLISWGFEITDKQTDNTLVFHSIIFKVVHFTSNIKKFTHPNYLTNLKLNQS